MAIRFLPTYLICFPIRFVSADVFSEVRICKLIICTVPMKIHHTSTVVIVLDPGEGVCADPVKRGAILEGEGPGPPSGDSERQLSKQGRWKDVTGWNEEMARSQGRLPLHGFRT